MTINNAENLEKNSISNVNEFNNKIDDFVFNWTFSILDENSTENDTAEEDLPFWFYI